MNVYLYVWESIVLYSEDQRALYFLHLMDDILQ